MLKRKRAAPYVPDPRLFDASIFGGETDIALNNERWSTFGTKGSPPISDTSSDEGGPRTAFVGAEQLVRLPSGNYCSIARNLPCLRRLGLLPPAPASSTKASSQVAQFVYDQSKEFENYRREMRQRRETERLVRANLPPQRSRRRSRLTLRHPTHSASDDDNSATPDPVRSYRERVEALRTRGRNNTGLRRSARVQNQSTGQTLDPISLWETYREKFSSCTARYG